MKKLRYLALSIIAVGALCIWSAAIRHVYLGGTGLGNITMAVRQFCEFPSLVKQLFTQPLVGSYFKVNSEFEEYDHLDRDLWILGSYYDLSDRTWSVQLSNLKDNSVINRWTISEQDLAGNKYLGYDGRSKFTQSIRFDHLRPLSPILLSKSMIAVIMEESNNLICYNEDGVRWQNNDFVYHHSLQKGAAENIWACGTVHSSTGHNAAFKNPGGQLVPYRDDVIVEIGADDGRTLSARSVSDILANNGYSGLLAIRVENDFDPVHLNDVEPVLSTSEYWKKGDLFVSMRNLNTVFLYRPANDSILWLKTGPFMAQHDIDVLNSNEISVFNNNYLIPNSREALVQAEIADIKIISNLSSSQYLIYSFKTDSVSVRLKRQFEDANIASPTEGLVQTLSNGDVFVENQNSGELYIFRPGKGIVLKKVFWVSGMPGMAHLPNWSRIYEVY